MRKVKSSAKAQTALLLCSALILLVLVVLPLGTLMVKAFQDKQGAFIGFGNFRDYFASPNLVGSIWNTLWVSFLSTLIAVLLALGYAYALSRTALRFKALLKMLAMLPLFAPTMMLGIGLIYLLGNKGLVTATGLKLPLYGPLGIIISEVLYAFPQAFLILSVSLGFADNRLYEAADVMGVSPAKQFFTITLPSVKYGLISAAFVAFTLSFTDFGAPKVVGGNYNVLATDVYKQVVGQQNFGTGSVVGLLLMIPAVLSFIVDRLTQSKDSGAVNARTVGYVVKPSKARDWTLGVYCWLIAGLILMVFLAVLLAALVKIWPYNMSLTFEHFLVNSPVTGGYQSYFNSLLTAFVSAVIGTAFVFLVAYLVEKMRGAKPLRQAAYFLSILPMALPGLVIGISYIFFFSAPSNPLHGVYGTMAILVLSNLVHFYSVPFVTATSALKKLDREFELVSESMRVPFYKTFFRVTVPMSLGAILEIFIYYFVNAMATVSAVVFLYPARFKLASIAIVNMEDAGDIAPAAALSVLIILTNVLARLAYELIARRINNKQTRRAQ